jgi:hypothetical protein
VRAADASDGFVESRIEPVRCEPESGDEPPRSSARRIWHRHITPQPWLAQAAAIFSCGVAAAPGRVHEGDGAPPAETLEAVAQLMPPAWRSALAPRLQWYACRGAFFHHDAHFSRVLFGAWCVGGPPREIVYPRLSLRLAAQPGDVVVFDPFEPHGVLDPGETTYRRERYLDAEPSVFVGFELALGAPIEQDFSIGSAPSGGPRLSSRTPINAETGAVAGC